MPAARGPRTRAVAAGSGSHIVRKVTRHDEDLGIGGAGRWRAGRRRGGASRPGTRQGDREGGRRTRTLQIPGTRAAPPRGCHDALPRTAGEAEPAGRDGRCHRGPARGGGVDAAERRGATRAGPRGRRCRGQGCRPVRREVHGVQPGARLALPGRTGFRATGGPGGASDGATPRAWPARCSTRTTRIWTPRGSRHTWRRRASR